MTVALYLVGVTVMWVLAWGALTLANVVGGLAVAAFLLLVSPDRLVSSGGVAFRPVAVVRFTAFVAYQVVKSNLLVVRSVLASRTRVHTGVMEIRLPDCSDELLTIITNVVALTAGTSPLHLTRQPTVLYVHVLDMRDADATRRDVHRLADLTFAAFGNMAPEGGDR